MKRVEDIIDKIYENRAEVESVIEKYKKKKNNKVKNTILIYSAVALVLVLDLIISKVVMRNR